MSRRAWIVYPRTSGKKKRSYYAAFLNPETGDYLKRRALKTDTVPPRPVTDKQTAELIAAKLYETGAATRSTEELSTYLAGFWAADGAYVSGRVLAGRPLATAYVFDMRRCIELYVGPWLKNPRVLNQKTGKWEDRDSIERLAIDRWTPGHAEDLMKCLHGQGHSAKRCNDVRKAISTALSIYWKRKGQKERNPMRGVEKYHEEEPKRVIFSSTEVRKFFAQKMDPRLWTINALAATGGLRLGECLGLTRGAVTKEELKIGKSKVTVYQVEILPKGNWQPKEGRKDPKWKSFGKVTIPSKVGQALQKLIKVNRFENEFVFFGSSSEAPIPRKTVETEFAKTCHAIGIPELERRRRRLSFHAWRHWYEAQYRGKIDDHVLREQMRHKSLKMTERYSHVTEEQAQLVAKVAAGLF